MDKKNCIKCKAVIEYDTKFCPFCGGRQPGNDTFVKEKAESMQAKKPGQKMRVPVLVSENAIEKDERSLTGQDKKSLDKSLKKDEANELEYKAYHDQLTGMKNRQAFEEDIKKISQKEAAIVSVDANGLKETNDTFGHKYGDLLLQMIAESLTDVFGDCVYRIGGDEFIVLEEGIGEKILQNKIDQFYHGLANKKNRMDEVHKDFLAEAAVGYAFGNGEKSIKEILDEADRKMYEDKKRGKAQRQSGQVKEAGHLEEDSYPPEYNANYDGYYNDVEPLIEKEEKEFSKEIMIKAVTAIAAFIVFTVIFELLI